MALAACRPVLSHLYLVVSSQASLALACVQELVLDKNGLSGELVLGAATPRTVYLLCPVERTADRLQYSACRPPCRCLRLAPLCIRCHRGRRAATRCPSATPAGAGAGGQGRASRATAAAGRGRSGASPERTHRLGAIWNHITASVSTSRASDAGLAQAPTREAAMACT